MHVVEVVCFGLIERIKMSYLQTIESFDDESGISKAGYDVLSDYYPDVWEDVSDFGKISTGILDLYMLAFKLAMKQLRERNEL